ncbi:helix-turn-helix domain-containing protein [Microbacterium sp. SA39]|uniref:helix-turn-helix domain-containing protein n=1 Tax=Microbacterium sp. SA39 TaxID=1263625 RepID=UPI0005FA6A33|nr:hypothetical protein RS85_02268 [Microbacterium sp. SA39]
MGTTDATPAAKRPLALSDIAGRTTISVEDAGRVFGLSRPAAYAAVHRGEIPVRRFGRRMVVPVPALMALLEAGD